MGLFDLFSNSKQTSAYCHLKNLIILANVDHQIINEEINVIGEVMVRESLTEDDFQKAIAELKHEGLLSINVTTTPRVKIIQPSTKDKALVYLQDMIALMLIDGDINDEEKEFCKYVAKKYGYEPSIIDVMIPFVLKKAKELSINILDNNVAPIKTEEKYAFDFSSSMEDESMTHSQIEANKLFDICKQGVIFIRENFKEFPSEGEFEALIFCSIFLVDMKTPHLNMVDINLVEDCYFLLLHDYIFDENIDIVKFIDSRIDFYQSEFQKLKNSPTYSPMFIYNTFYMNPYTMAPKELKEFNESPLTLLEMQEILYKAILYMNELKH